MIKLYWFGEYLGVRAYFALIRILPIRLAMAAGKVTGFLAGKILKKRMALAHHNLEYALGFSLTPEQRNRIIRDLLRLLGQSLVEVIRFRPQDVERLVRVQGMENLDHVKNLGLGVIMLTAHFGPWEALTFCFSQKTQNAGVIYKPLKNPWLNRFLLNHRARSGLEMIENKDALKIMVRKLRKAQFAGMLFDQNAAGNGVPALFFGKPASTHPAPAALALRTGCVVCPALIFHEPGTFRQYRLEIGKPFDLIRTGDAVQDVLANTQQYNNFLEQQVRRRPEHWFGWFHKRWSGHY